MERYTQEEAVGVVERVRQGWGERRGVGVWEGGEGKLQEAAEKNKTP